LHSGITGLLDIAYNRGACTIIILDNWTTAMTGRQDHPGTGMTITGEPTSKVDYVKLAKALGIKHIKKINPFDVKALERVLRREVNRAEPSVIVADAPCVLYRRVEKAGPRPVFYVDASQCIGCKACLRIGCPAIQWTAYSEQQAALRGKQKGESYINPYLCAGCDVCAQLCKKGAIKKKGERQ
jgi:indolepyruvate ferredoxin oxidoreductase alpha subunit